MIHASFYTTTRSSQPSEAAAEEVVESTPATAGPWSEKAQHGGPPAALLGRAVERVLPGGQTVGRFTMDLLGPVPVGPLAVSASIVRPGRSVNLVEARLDDDGHPERRTVARARAWSFPLTEDGPSTGSGTGAQGSGTGAPRSGTGAPRSGTGAPGSGTGPGHSPDDGHEEEPPPGWHRGYLDSIEWRWISGAITRPGRAVAWMRARIPVVEGEEPSPLQRLLTCVDSASGVSAALDVREWAFLNTDLSVQVFRPVEGEWVCLDAETTLGTGSVGSAVAEVYDARGLVARSSQTLLVARR